MNGGGEALDWGALLSLYLHPTKVLIIGALRDAGTPLSATQIVQALGETVDLSSVFYHLHSLAKKGVLYQVYSRRVRGATERFFTFTDAVRL